MTASLLESHLRPFAVPFKVLPQMDNSVLAFKSLPVVDGDVNWHVSVLRRMAA